MKGMEKFDVVYATDKAHEVLGILCYLTAEQLEVAGEMIALGIAAMAKAEGDKKDGTVG